MVEIRNLFRSIERRNNMRFDGRDMWSVGLAGLMIGFLLGVLYMYEPKPDPVIPKQVTIYHSEECKRLFNACMMESDHPQTREYCSYLVRPFCSEEYPVPVNP